MSIQARVHCPPKYAVTKTPEGIVVELRFIGSRLRRSIDRYHCKGIYRDLLYICGRDSEILGRPRSKYAL